MNWKKEWKLFHSKNEFVVNECCILSTQTHKIDNQCNVLYSTFMTDITLDKNIKEVKS